MRILVASGSSGGHIFPAVALVNFLKKEGATLLLVLPLKSKDTFIPPDCAEVEYISSGFLSFSLSTRNISGLFNFLKGAAQGLRIIIKFKPDVVVGFGSLHTVALLFWGWLFRIKTVIHEQNVIPGKANRILARLVDKVAISFASTQNYLNLPSDKITLTGNPIRNELVKVSRQEALNFFKFPEGKFNILIAGGSQGSHKINAVAYAAITSLTGKQNLQIIHICGKQDFANLNANYLASGINYKLYEFFPDMQYAYSLADLVICRAGATTIAELQKFNLPALLIPYPFAAAHQLANALVLKDIGAAEIIPDADLDIDKLKERLQTYLAGHEKLKAMQKAYQKLLVYDATARLANEVLSLK
ncbi:MAG: undecaprenyldiphospho-muramoylpentapeptide beta-N-acetylglucosaminyltransferase [Candidatus Omnitrophica bacterium]|nr:undecaprenyldiphospho-muramoylpentapeptide beta-N-acetylglucosaminyltransferase [Candidatus Omnitrophota bacterium]